MLYITVIQDLSTQLKKAFLLLFIRLLLRLDHSQSGFNFSRSNAATHSRHDANPLKLSDVANHVLTGHLTGQKQNSGFKP